LETFRKKPCTRCTPSRNPALYRRYALLDAENLPVVRDDAESVGLEDHDGLARADAGGKPVDQGQQYWSTTLPML
jgi:hypothetical protein